MNIEELTVKQICNCIAVINKMTEEKLIKFNPNKACVQFNYDKVTKYLEEQNIKQQKQLEAYENMRKEVIKWVEDNVYIDYYGMPVIRNNSKVDDLLNILNKGDEDNE